MRETIFFFFPLEKTREEQRKLYAIHFTMTSIADARSDTVTKPTSRMREAMASCDVGDDVMNEDPTLHLLEARVAKLLNFEKALFFPTGTMANLTAIMSWCDGRNLEMIGKNNIFLLNLT